MKIIDKQKQQILLCLATVPLASGHQLQKLFLRYAHPDKRLSACLNELTQEGLVEGKLRPIGESKVWRLTKKGHQWMEVDRKAVSFSNRHADHYLGIADVYFTLLVSDQLQHFICEPRILYGDSVYAPDAFLVWEGIPYFLEVQRTPISQSAWEEKWKRVERFYGHHLPMVLDGYTVTAGTSVIALCRQRASTLGGASFPLLIGREIGDVFSIEEKKKERPIGEALLDAIEKDILLSRLHYENPSDSSITPPFSKEALQKYAKLVGFSGKR